MSAEHIVEALSSGRLSLTVLDDGSAVVLDERRESLLTLNPSALVVMQGLASGTTNFDELAGALQNRFSIDRDTAMGDVHRFIQDLAATL